MVHVTVERTVLKGISARRYPKYTKCIFWLRTLRQAIDP